MRNTKKNSFFQSNDKKLLAQRHARKWIFLGALAFLLSFLSPLRAQFEYAESFQGTTATGWNFVTGDQGAGPSLTAATGVDTDGSGWLRLTNNTNYQANAVWLNTAIPSVSNTIQVSFDMAMWGNSANPGDGIGFFLWDASVPFSTGASGGSFGYAQKTGTDGMTNGYIGVALDVYGNYSSATEGREGGLGTGLYPDRVGVRGPGNGQTGYDYIDSTVSTLAPYSLDFASNTSRPDQSTQYRKVRITLDSNDLLTVEVQFGENGLWVTLFSQDITSLGIRPDQLRLGYSASTGDATEYYEIRNLTVTATGTGDSSYWDNGAGTSIWDALSANAPNWNPDFTPSDRANIVFNDSYVTTNQNIMVKGTRTVSSIFFSGTYSYSLNTNATNNGLIIFDTGISTVAAVLAVTNSPNGNQDNSINLPVTLHNNLTINNYVNQNLTLSGTISMGANSITNQGNGTTILAGVVSGTGGINENGSTGTLILSNANTYTGLTTVTAGTLFVQNAGALGSTAAGTVVQSNGSYAGTLMLGNNITVTNETLALNGLGDGGQGALLNNNGTNTWAGTISLSSSSSVAANAGTTLNLTGVVSGSNSNSGFIKEGDGRVILSATNSYNGPTTINDGILQINADSGLGTAPGGASASRLIFNGGILATSNSFQLNGNRGILLSTNGGTIETDGTATVSYGGIMTGNGDFTKSGSGTLILSGTNTNTGSTDINGGTLVVNSANTTSGAIVNTSSVNIASGVGAALALSTSETIGSLSGGGTVSLAGNTLTTGGSNASTTYDGNIMGTGGLTKTGTGTMVLSGTNSYSGATTISGGTLALGNDNVLSNNSSLILNGGTLAVNGYNDTVGTLTLSASSTIDFNSITSVFTISSFSSTVNGILTIDNWTGSIAGGSGSQLFLTNVTNSSNLLNAIQFEGYGVGATRLTTGEVVPSVIANGFYWNNTGANWNSTDAWNNGTNSLSGTGDPSSSGALAVFGKLNAYGSNSGNIAKTVTLSNNRTVGYIVFNSALSDEDYTITGGSTLRFNNTGNAYINMTSTASNTIATAIALSTSLVISQNGVGTLYLTNTLTTNDNDITVDGLGKTVISSILGGTTTLTKSGTGTLTLSGANTYTGGSYLNGGTVAINAGSNLGNTTSAITFSGGTLAAYGSLSRSGTVTLNAGGGTIDVTNSATVTTSGVYSGVGGLTKSGAGTLILSNSANTYTGTTTIAGGTLTVIGGSAINNTASVVVANVSGALLNLSASETIGSISGGGTTGGAINLNGNTLTTGGNNSSTSFDGLIYGTGAFTKTGTGTMVLTNNANTYSGITSVNGGELIMVNTGGLGTGVVTVANGAMLTLSSASPMTTSASKTITLSGTGMSNQGALNNESGNNTWTGTVTLVGNSTIGFNGGNMSLSGPLLLTSYAATLGGNYDGYLTGTISSTSTTGSLIKTGLGTVTVSGNNSYTGNTTVSGGTLAITSNTALGATNSGTTVTNGGSLALSNNITVNNESLVLLGLGVDYGTTHSGVIQSRGNNTITGTVAMSLEPGINVVSGNLTMSGTISGTSGMSKAGVGTLILNGNNSFIGAVSVNEGILSVQSNNALGTTSTSVRTNVMNGATVQLTTSGNLSLGESFTINGNGFSNSGAIYNGAGINTISGLISLGSDAAIGVAGGSTLSATNVIDGAASLTKSGSGTLILSATNTYTGATNILGGTLVISADNNLGTAVAIPTANQLTFNGSTLATSNSFAIDANRGITFNGTGGTISVNNAATVTYAGTADGTGGLTKTGNGTLVLSGNNNYTGATVVSGGTLSLGNNNVLANTSSLILNGGTLATNGYSDIVGAFTLSASSTINMGGILADSDFVLASMTGNVGTTLTISNWTGSVMGGVGSQIYSSTSVSSTFLNQISFVGYDPGAIQLATGEIVPLVVGGARYWDNGSNSWDTTASRWNSYSGAVAGSAPGIVGGSGTTSQVVVFGALDAAGTGSGNNAATTVTMTGSRTVGNVIFNSTYSGEAYTISGGANTLVFDVTTGNAGIVMTSPASNTISANIALSDSIGITQNGTGTLYLTGGTLTTNNNNVTVGGSGNTVISDNISASTTVLTKTGTGSLTLSGTNAYSGGTAINGGTVAVSTAANLGTTNSTLTFGGGTLAANGTFSRSGNVVLNAGGGTINVTNSATVTTSGVYSGSGGLTKDGAGTLVLSNSGNNYSGVTTVTGGTLVAATGNSLSSNSALIMGNVTGANAVLTGSQTVSSLAGGGTNGGNISISGGNTLTVGRDNTSTTYAGVISGNNANLVKTGTGTMILSGANTYTGSTTVTGGGTLGLGNNNVLANNSSLILNGGTFATNGYTDQIGAMSVTASSTLDMGSNPGVSMLSISSLVLTSGNTLTISGWTGSVTGGVGTQFYSTATYTSTYLSLVTFDGYDPGAFQLTSGEIVPYVLAGARYWDSPSANWGTTSATLWNNMYGTNSATVPGYSANSTASQVVVFGAIDAAGTGKDNTAKTVTMTSNRTVGYIVFNSTFSGETYTIAGGGNTLILDVTSANGTATINMTSTASNTIAANIALSNSLVISQNSATGSLNITGNITTNNNDISVDGIGKTIITGTFGGTTSLFKDGTGTLTLSGTNSYTGGTTINGGTIAISRDDNLGSTANRTVTFDGGILATNQITNSMTLSGNMVLESGGATINVSSYSATSSVTSTGTYSGTGGLTKDGNGTLIMYGANNSFTGITSVSNGTLIAANNGALSPNSALVMGNNTGSAVVLSVSQSVASLAGGGANGGNINLNNNSLTAGGDNTSTTYAGVISGTGSFTKTGTGTMVISGQNTYTGNTNINGGTLMLGADNALSDNTNITMGGNATLATNSHTDTVGTLTLTGNSTIDMSNWGPGSTIHFADSSAIDWSTNILYITNYNYYSDNDYIYFGTNSSGLSAEDIGQIRFVNPLGMDPGVYGARILADGRIVPIVPEPSTIIGALLLIAFAIWRYFHRRRPA